MTAPVSHQLDPELADILAAFGPGHSAPGRGDWKALRAATEQGQADLAGLVPASEGVRRGQSPLGRNRTRP
jgi:hypothetical protein